MEIVWRQAPKYFEPMNFHGTASINLFPFHSQPQIFKQNFTSTIRYLKHAKNQKDVDLKSLSRFEILE